MSIKDKTDKIKKWMKEKKSIIIASTGILTVVVITTIIANKQSIDKDATGMISNPGTDFDSEKGLEMHFIDPENGDILWKELCTESYMQEMKDSGMEFDTIRKLNGIEEA